MGAPGTCLPRGGAKRPSCLADPWRTRPRGHPSPAAGLRPHSAQRFCSPFLVQVGQEPLPGPSLMLDTFRGRILGLVRHF